MTSLDKNISPFFRIQITYGTLTAPYHGGNGGDPGFFSLGSDEYIVEVEGRADSRFVSLVVAFNITILETKPNSSLNENILLTSMIGMTRMIQNKTNRQWKSPAASPSSPSLSITSLLPCTSYCHMVTFVFSVWVYSKRIHQTLTGLWSLVN